MRRRPILLLCLTLLAASLSGSNATAAEKIRLLIIDGQNNHNWKIMTPPMKATLERTGLFTVDVATTPEKNARPEAWSNFRPDFSQYRVVLSNYNGQEWPAEVRAGFEKFVKDGGGVVIIHAANNPFPEWKAFNEMIGLGWRPAAYGERVTVDDAGKQVRTAAGEGPGAGHGPQHAYPVVIRDPNHPITKGMPREWMHHKDELYHGQRGPGQGMHILATAYSAPDQKGTGAHEPMAWTINYGKGRIFTCLLGHVMGDDVTSMRDVGFQTLMCRGAEWAATGQVSQEIPKNFPTATAVSLAPE
jgi:type 1 glutamine amidotransferase